MELRIQKYLAECGICSRRKAEELIEKGLIKINGSTATLGQKMDDNFDVIEYKGKVVKREKKLYIMLHKPNSCVATSNEQFGRNTVVDIVKKDLNERLYCVGRLDYNTEGLIFLTNDGDFADKVIHPSNNVYKTYIAHVKGGTVSFDDVKALRQGVKLEDGVTKPARVKIVELMPNGTTVIEISIKEGRNRQVRRMFDAIDHPVIYLKRIAIGDVKLGNLPYGKWRHLTPEEIYSLSK